MSGLCVRTVQQKMKTMSTSCHRMSTWCSKEACRGAPGSVNNTAYAVQTCGWSVDGAYAPASKISGDPSQSVTPASAGDAATRTQRIRSNPLADHPAARLWKKAWVTSDSSFFLVGRPCCGRGVRSCHDVCTCIPHERDAMPNRIAQDFISSSTQGQTH